MRLPTHVQRAWLMFGLQPRPGQNRKTPWINKHQRAVSLEGGYHLSIK